MCLNHDLCVFWVSSLAYPNSLGTKDFVVVVVVVVVVCKNRLGLVPFLIRKPHSPFTYFKVVLTHFHIL